MYNDNIRRYRVTSEVIVTTEFFEDPEDVDRAFTNELMEGWDGLFDLTLERVRVSSVIEAPADPAEYHLEEAQRVAKRAVHVARGAAPAD